jgi:hypothetical protein
MVLESSRQPVHGRPMYRWFRQIRYNRNTVPVFPVSLMLRNRCGFRDRHSLTSDELIGDMSRSFFSADLPDSLRLVAQQQSLSERKEGLSRGRML